MIDQEHENITISRQCELLELPRASYYYESTRDDNYNELITVASRIKLTKSGRILLRCFV